MDIIGFDGSLLIIRGHDKINFLNGLTTNNMENLKPKQPIKTVFTQKSAKIIDVVHCIHMEDFIAITGYRGHLQELIKHLKKQILNADVQISDATNRNNFYRIISEEKPNFGINETIISDGPLVWLAIVPSANRLDENLTSVEWNEYRIKHIIPDYDHEISPKFHPLAVGLGDLVHPAKGCYIGQEILARMVSRQRQGRKLIVENRELLKENDITTLGENYCLAVVKC
ncbi:MAG TPA: hypothetical protein D7H86_06300 [Candidatus Poseidoniales archaeon]|nr:MAG TPA: hypothetical protein D7H86_06300 [Candidatus Poseidoniales archaeon]